MVGGAYAGGSVLSAGVGAYAGGIGERIECGGFYSHTIISVK